MNIFSYLYQQHGQPGLYPASALACSLDDAPYSRLTCSLSERNLINPESWAHLYGAMPGEFMLISHPSCLYTSAIASLLDEKEAAEAIALYETRLQAERDRIIAQCRQMPILADILASMLPTLSELLETK